MSEGGPGEEWGEREGETKVKRLDVALFLVIPSLSPQRDRFQYARAEKEGLDHFTRYERMQLSLSHVCLRHPISVTAVSRFRPANLVGYL